MEECAEFDLALHDLRPVAGQFHLGDGHTRFRVRCPGRRLEFRHRFRRSHIGPDKAAGLARRVGQMPGLFRQRACLRLRRHVDDVAVGVELPAVIEATKAAFLVAAEGERGLAMRTGFAEHPNLAVAIAERDELFSEQLQAHRSAVRLRDLFRQHRRHPVAAHQPPHRRIALDPAQQFVFGLRQHGLLSRKILSLLSNIIRRGRPVQRRPAPSPSPLRGGSTRAIGERRGGGFSKNRDQCRNNSVI